MLTYPNCKINLGLRVLRRRADGYHDIESVFVPVPWCDELEIVRAGTFSFVQEGIPVGGDAEDNLVVKAYRLVHGMFPDRVGAVGIRLKKNIPFGAGLGGGSSDAAFAVRMLNDLFSLGMPSSQMADIVSRLGADCRFFVDNVPSCVTGIGDCVSPLGFNPLAGAVLLIVKPSFSVSTAMAYKGITPRDEYGETLVDVLSLPMCGWKGVVTNDFERSVFGAYPLLSSIKDAMYDSGAVYASMSGSGSTIYGIYSPASDLDSATKRMSSFGQAMRFDF